jgi:hypothetical protein
VPFATSSRRALCDASAALRGPKLRVLAGARAARAEELLAHERTGGGPDEDARLVDLGGEVGHVERALVVLTDAEEVRERGRRRSEGIAGSGGGRRGAGRVGAAGSDEGEGEGAAGKGGGKAKDGARYSREV